jgi:hypothetical protein
MVRYNWPPHGAGRFHRDCRSDRASLLGPMNSTLGLLLFAIGFAQPTMSQSEPPILQLVRGQEIVHQGQYIEQRPSQGNRSTRSFQIETRVFVLEAGHGGYEVALYTVLRVQGSEVMSGEGRVPASVWLETTHVNEQGKVDVGSALLVPLAGPPIAECGQFVELPGHIDRMNQSWQVADGSRPVRTWTYLGWDDAGGIRCLKLQGVQQSADWDQPRADQTAWKRVDRVWMRRGIAYRIERTIERRLPAHDRPTDRSVMRLELRSELVYPGRLYEGRRRDIMQAVAFTAALAPYLAAPATFGQKPFDDLLIKGRHYIDNEPPTPYRDAILQVTRRIEAARRGESPPVLTREDRNQGTQALVLGERAPEFVVENAVTRQSVGLENFLGKPTLMVFYHPRSEAARSALHFAQRLEDSSGRAVNAAGFALVDTVEGAREQPVNFPINIPVLVAGSLKQSYGVETTPKIVILDAAGVARAAFEGWGPETGSAVAAELKRWPADRRLDRKAR